MKIHYIVKHAEYTTAEIYNHIPEFLMKQENFDSFRITHTITAIQHIQYILISSVTN